MKKILTTVVITTANNPPTGVPYLAMTNTSERRMAAKAALYFWASQGIRNIIVADATGNNLLSKAELDEVSLLGASIEQISYFQNEQNVISKGKGYAEGELIKFTIENSRLLENEDRFYKSTGKTFVRNFPAIHDLVVQTQIDTVFWPHIDPEGSISTWADCRFYLTSKLFAVESLIPAYLQSYDGTLSCEYTIYELLNRTLSLATGLRPLISGFAGGTGEQYFDGGLGFRIYNTPCWISRP